MNKLVDKIYKNNRINNVIYVFYFIIFIMNRTLYNKDEFVKLIIVLFQYLK